DGTRGTSWVRGVCLVYPDAVRIRPEKGCSFSDWGGKRVGRKRSGARDSAGDSHAPLVSCPLWGVKIIYLESGLATDSIEGIARAVPIVPPRFGVAPRSGG